MQWKGDSIEEFVRYKIEHPEESFMTLRSYEAQKRHNENIEKLYKELNKYRSELNHFKTELWKLNQASARQIGANEEQTNRVNEKIVLINQKMKKAKSLEGVSPKQQKRLMVEEYKETVRVLQKEKEDEEALGKREAEEIITKIDEGKGMGKRGLVLGKIENVKRKIEGKVKEMRLYEEKSKRVKELTQKYNQQKQKVSSMSRQLAQTKRKRQQLQRQELHAKSNHTESTLKRLQKFTGQFVTVAKSQVSPSSEAIQSVLLLGDEPVYSTASRKWTQMQAQLSESVQTLKEYMRRVEYYVQSSFAQTERREDQRAQVSAEESQRYLKQTGVLAQIEVLGDSSVYEQQLKAIAENIDRIRVKTKDFYDNADTQIKSKETENDLKEIQLDKQIAQLHAKVAKTDLQISKFNKNRH